MIMNCDSILLFKSKDKKSTRSTSMLTKNLKNLLTYHIKQNQFTMLSNNEINNYCFDKIITNSNKLFEIYTKSINFTNNILFMITSNQSSQQTNGNTQSLEHYFLEFFQSVLSKVQSQEDNLLKLSIFDINQSEIIDVTTRSKLKIMNYQIQFMSELKKIMSRKEYLRQQSNCRFYKMQIFKSDDKINEIVFLQTPYFDRFIIKDQILSLFSRRKSKKMNQLLNWGVNFSILRDFEINVISVVEEKANKNPKVLLDFVSQFKENMIQIKQKNSYLRSKSNVQTKQNSRIIVYTKNQNQIRQFQNKQNKSSLKNKDLQPSSVIKYEYIRSKNQIDDSSQSDSEYASRTGRTLQEQKKPGGQRYILKLENQNRYLKLKLKKQNEQFENEKNQFVQKYKRRFHKLKNENQQLKKELQNQKEMIQQLNNKITLLQAQQINHKNQFNNIQKQNLELKAEKQNLNIQINNLKLQFEKTESKYSSDLKIYEDQMEILKKRFNEIDQVHLHNMQNLQSQLDDMRLANQHMKKQVEKSKYNQSKYIDQLNKLEYRLEKQRGKYYTEKQNNKRLSQELEMMDMKLNKIINMKTKKLTSENQSFDCSQDF